MYTEQLRNALLSYTHTIKIDNCKFQNKTWYIKMTMTDSCYKPKYVCLEVERYNLIYWKIGTDLHFHRVVVGTLVNEEHLEKKIHTLLHAIRKLL